jgi:hypothetical protein
MYFADRLTQALHPLTGDLLLQVDLVLAECHDFALLKTRQTHGEGGPVDVPPVLPAEQFPALREVPAELLHDALRDPAAELDAAHEEIKSLPQRHVLRDEITLAEGRNGDRARFLEFISGSAGGLPHAPARCPRRCSKKIYG